MTPHDLPGTLEDFIPHARRHGLSVMAPGLAPPGSPIVAVLVQTGPGLDVDPLHRTVRVDGLEIELTRREFDLLAALVARPGRVLTRAQLLAIAWGEGSPQRPGGRTVDVHVARVRQAIGEPYARRLQTMRGVGYRWLG